MLEPQKWDSTRSIVIPGDKEQTIQYCAKQFVALSQEAIKNHGQFCVALSGGSTPKAVFELISKAPYCEQIEWNNVHLFWSDERTVGADHPDSNYKMAMDAGLKNVEIPVENIHRIEGEKPVQDAALEYENTIKKVLPERPFDMIMLGMGDDGHTASLFPNTVALSEQSRLVIENHVPQKETWRITMTYPCINFASNIVFYVLGDGKKLMIKEVLEGKTAYPACSVGTEKNKALFILDKDAAQLIQQK